MAPSVAETRDEPAIDDREDAALRFHRGVGRLIQHAPHVLVTLGTAVTVVAPRTLLVSGTGAHPRGAMLRGREGCGGRADLRDDLLRGIDAASRDLGQPLHRVV